MLSPSAQSLSAQFHSPLHQVDACLEGGDCKRNPFCFHPLLTFPSHFCSCFQLAPQCCTYHLRPATTSNSPPASATLACHVALTCTYTYLPVSALFFISVTLYISPYLQVDPYPFLFGSHALFQLSAVCFLLSDDLFYSLLIYSS